MSKLYRINIQERDGKIYYGKVEQVECTQEMYDFVNDQFLMHDKPMTVMLLPDNKMFAGVSTNYYHLVCYSLGLYSENMMRKDFDAYTQGLMQ